MNELKMSKSSSHHVLAREDLPIATKKVSAVFQKFDEEKQCYVSVVEEIEVPISAIQKKEPEITVSWRGKESTIEKPKKCHCPSCSFGLNNH